jgi:trimeric autotransporter adhesin
MASTYSNLSIELIGTGDQSGTWGTTTNTNLGTALEEAIVGTVNQAVTTVDLTLPWSTASNATQVARHLRLNLTGSSGGASNLIVPTLSGGKNYYIKNSSTTAITVKTAAGTGILVPAGKSASLYQDGTNVVEAADYSTSYTIGTLTTTNDATINGLTVGKGANAVSTNTALGVSALNSITTGSANTALGYQALTNSTASNNTAVGMQSMLANTTGTVNTAVGNSALGANISGSDNVAMGVSAMLTNTTGGSNAGIGRNALRLNTTGANNTALGKDALYSNTTASNNTAVGLSSWI